MVNDTIIFSVGFLFGGLLGMLSMCVIAVGGNRDGKARMDEGAREDKTCRSQISSVHKL